MSEISNHNLASEFRKHPDRAYWLLNKVLPAMAGQFEEFDIDMVVGQLTDDTMTSKKIKQNYNAHQRKQNKFTPKIQRARPAYQFFCNANRTQLKQENPDMEFGDINKMLGDMWANLGKKDKKPFEKEAEKDKERYNTEFKKAEEEAIANGSYKPDPLKGVKKAKTSYLCFSTDENVRNKYKKEAGDDIKELMRLLGKKWRKMSEKERKPYVEQAEEDKVRYEKEKAVALKRHSKLQASLNSNKQSDNEEVESENDNEEEVHVPAKKTKPSSKKPSSKKPSSKKTTKKPKQSVSSDEEEE